MGDFLASSSILFSGNNFDKIAKWAKFMNLDFVNSTTHYRIQRSYAVPAVSKYWDMLQQETLDKIGDRPVILAGLCTKICLQFCFQHHFGFSKSTQVDLKIFGQCAKSVAIFSR